MNKFLLAFDSSPAKVSKLASTVELLTTSINNNRGAIHSAWFRSLFVNLSEPKEVLKVCNRMWLKLRSHIEEAKLNRLINFTSRQ